MANLKASEKRAIRQLAHQVSSFLQRRIYEQSTAALMRNPGVTAERTIAIALCLRAAFDAVRLTDESDVSL